MTYTKINLYLANGIPEALSNLWYGSDSAVVEIRDAVEDAKIVEAKPKKVAAKAGGATKAGAAKVAKKTNVGKKM